MSRKIKIEGKVKQKLLDWIGKQQSHPADVTTLIKESVKVVNNFHHLAQLFRFSGLLVFIKSAGLHPDTSRYKISRAIDYFKGEKGMLKWSIH